jgi:hypothetical protein
MTMGKLTLTLLAGAVSLTGGTALAKDAGLSAAAKRGGYLVNSGGCNHCHTPWVFNPDLGMPVPDMTRMLSGHPEKGPDPEGKRGAHDIGLIGPTFTSFQMPFGIVYAPNLTPDKDTGMGTWTETMFVGAFRKGKHMGADGRAILPPMPWMDIAGLNDADLKAVYAYLHSIPAVHNAVPEHKVPLPAIDAITGSFVKLQAAMAAMKAQKPGAAAAPVKAAEPAKVAETVKAPAAAPATAPMPAK